MTRDYDQLFDEVQPQVLIIDDEPGLVDLLRRFLELENIPAIGFSRPLEALRWFEDHFEHTKVVVLDLKMPRHDGRECLEVLKDIDPDVEVAIFSGVPGISERPPEDPAICRVFQKPVDLTVIVRWVARQVRRRSAVVHLPNMASPSVVKGS